MEGRPTDVTRQVRFDSVGIPFQTEGEAEVR
jgi:hypothetical protein